MMKKALVLLALLLVLTCGFTAQAATLSDADGDGLYEIATAQELMDLAAQVNSGKTVSAELTADIDLSGVAWTPIGTEANRFIGVFEGNGHTISGLSMNITSGGYYGLFGFTDGENTAGKTVIKNFTLQGSVTSSATAKTWFGSVAGEVAGKTELRNIQSCVSYTKSAGNSGDFVGGLVGQSGNATLDGCTYSGTLSIGSCAYDRAGGIMAYGYNGKNISITNCLFNGTLSSTYDATRAGGILGYYNAENGKNLTLSNCLSIGMLPEGTQALVGTLKNYGSTSAGSNNFYAEGLTQTVSNLETTAANTNDLQTGAVAYLLGSSWGQNLDNGLENQGHPVPGGASVYFGFINCGADSAAQSAYSNDSRIKETPQDPHLYENGVCIFCCQFEDYGGSGTELDPYTIANAGQLYSFAAASPAGYAKLTQSITVPRKMSPWVELPMWKPISSYTGNLDGCGYEISGLYHEGTGTGGLTATIHSVGSVKNLILRDCWLDYGYNIGGIAGLNNGLIQNCQFYGHVEGTYNLGGIAGRNHGEIKNCYAQVTVDGKTEQFGGIVGFSGIGTLIENCGAEITFVTTLNPDKIGGIVGYAEEESVIRNCWATIDAARVYEKLGSVVGYSEGTTVENCYGYGYRPVGTAISSTVSAHEVTLEWLGSGEIAYETGFGQRIGTDPLPVLGGATVYRYTDCAETYRYTNTQKADIENHTYADGKCTTCGYAQYLAQVGDTRYNTVQQALDENDGQLVVLLADSYEQVQVQGDLYLDLQGHNLRGVTTTGTLYGMDTATDDYGKTYGKIQSVEGTVRIYSNKKGKCYVPVQFVDGWSFQCFSMGITHASLKTSNQGFGYKAAFYGTDAAFHRVQEYGIKLWVTEDQVIMASYNQRITDPEGIIKSLRIQNILTGSETDAVYAQTKVYACTYVTINLDGQVITIETKPVAYSLAELINTVNANTGICNDAQLEALKTFVETYKGALLSAGCKMENILK